MLMQCSNILFSPSEISFSLSDILLPIIGISLLGDDLSLLIMLISLLRSDIPPTKYYSRNNKLSCGIDDACNLCIRHFRFKQVQVTLARSDGTVLFINALKQVSACVFDIT